MQHGFKLAVPTRSLSVIFISMICFNVINGALCNLCLAYRAFQSWEKMIEWDYNNSSWMFIVFGQTDHQNRRSAVIHQNKKHCFLSLPSQHQKLPPHITLASVLDHPNHPHPGQSDGVAMETGERGLNSELLGILPISRQMKPLLLQPRGARWMLRSQMNPIFSPLIQHILCMSQRLMFQTDTTRFPSGCTNHSQWKGKNKKTEDSTFCRVFLHSVGITVPFSLTIDCKVL